MNTDPIQVTFEQQVTKLDWTIRLQFRPSNPRSVMLTCKARPTLNYIHALPDDMNEAEVKASAADAVHSIHSLRKQAQRNIQYDRISRDTADAMAYALQVTGKTTIEGLVVPTSNQTHAARLTALQEQCRQALQKMEAVKQEVSKLLLQSTEALAASHNALAPRAWPTNEAIDIGICYPNTEVERKPIKADEPVRGTLRYDSHASANYQLVVQRAGSQPERIDTGIAPVSGQKFPEDVLRQLCLQHGITELVHVGADWCEAHKQKRQKPSYDWAAQNAEAAKAFEQTKPETVGTNPNYWKTR